MAERSNAAVSKTVVRQPADRGFESPSLREEGVSLGVLVKCGCGMSSSLRLFVKFS
jgi:hypothetical protein